MCIGLNLTPHDAKTVLNRLGYRVRENGGSHHIYTKPNETMITLANHGENKNKLLRDQIKTVAGAIKQAGGIDVFA